MGGQRQATAASPSGKRPIRVVQEAEAEWAPGTVWTGAENLAATGIRSPDRSARSESLYRLRCLGPQLTCNHVYLWYVCVINNKHVCNVRDEYIKSYFIKRHDAEL